MLEQSSLGKTVNYVKEYAPELLFPILRLTQRQKIGLKENLPFYGWDIWNGFELSWLNSKGKPEIAFLECIVPANSKYLIESKSFKLYLMSLSQTRFSSLFDVQKTIKKDLEHSIEDEVNVRVYKDEEPFVSFIGECLDQLDIETDIYQVTSEFLKVSERIVEESMFSHLLKSNCLATGQPDWGSVYIHYAGKQIDRPSLLQYIISYREHAGFHEDCVEQMFSDILKQCSPDKLTVYARYNRRGGLDINPFRSNFDPMPKNNRLSRQ